MNVLVDEKAQKSATFLALKDKQICRFLQDVSKHNISYEISRKPIIAGVVPSNQLYVVPKYMTESEYFSNIPIEQNLSTIPDINRIVKEIDDARIEILHLQS